MIFRSTYKKPVLVVGSGARLAGASELIYDFIKKTSIPVLTTMNAVDLVQDKYKFGFIGTYGNRVSNMIVSECDLLISVGARLGLRQVGNNPSRFAPKAAIIRADIDEYELSRDIRVDEEKHLIDAKTFMELLLSEDIPKYEEWNKTCCEAKDILAPYDNEIGNLTMKEISRFLPENPIVAVDIGQNQCWAAQSLHLTGEKGRMLIGGGYGSMGCALPYAIGASISTGNKAVFCITGDGGLQMNIQELETVKREGLPIKIIVINNFALGKISEIQEGSYNNRFAQTTAASGYSVPDFELVAKAYGIKATTLNSYKDLYHCKEWFTDEEACLINICLPEDTKLIPKINFTSGKILPELDDSVNKKVLDILSR